MEVVRDLLLQEMKVPGREVGLLARDRQPPDLGAERVEVSPYPGHAANELLRAGAERGRKWQENPGHLSMFSSSIKRPSALKRSSDRIRQRSSRC
jgi:hypothetical protein